MRLRIPPGCGAATHDGKILDIGENSYVEVAEDAVQALLVHGFAPLDDEEEAAVSGSISAPGISPADDGIDGLNRRELFAFLRTRNVSVSLPVTNEELRSLARRAALQTSLDPAENVSKGS